jgi:hypothetical protein
MVSSNLISGFNFSEMVYQLSMTVARWRETHKYDSTCDALYEPTLFRLCFGITQAQIAVLGCGFRQFRKNFFSSRLPSDTKDYSVLMEVEGNLSNLPIIKLQSTDSWHVNSRMGREDSLPRYLKVSAKITDFRLSYNYWLDSPALQPSKKWARHSVCDVIHRWKCFQSNQWNLNLYSSQNFFLSHCSQSKTSCPLSTRCCEDRLCQVWFHWSAGIG